MGIRFLASSGNSADAVLVQRPVEPGFGEGPTIVGGLTRDAEGFGRLSMGQSDKKPQLDEGGGRRIDGLQLVQSLVQSQQPFIRRKPRQFDNVEIDDSSHAYIAQDARVNQNSAYRGGAQVVRVEATNLVEAVHLAGVVGLTFFGAQGGEGGVGGSYLKVKYGGAVTAQIYAGAHVYADALIVRADSKTHNTSIAEAGLIGQTLCEHPDISEKFAELFG